MKPDNSYQSYYKDVDETENASKYENPVLFGECSPR